MKSLKVSWLLSILLWWGIMVNAEESDFKLFKESDQYSGFGGISFDMFQGKYIMIGGEGAAIFRNFYFGGFGHSGSIGNYTYPLSSTAYNLQRRSGGLMVGGISNGDQFLAVYTDLKLSWDRYEANAESANLGLPIINYRGFAFVPSAGVALRPISWMQLRLSAGYRYSGVIDDGGLENAPYSGANLNFQLTFGGF